MIAAVAFVDVDENPPASSELILRTYRLTARPPFGPGPIPLDLAYLSRELLCELAIPLEGVHFHGQESPVTVEAHSAPLCVLDAMRNAAAHLLAWRELGCRACGWELPAHELPSGGYATEACPRCNWPHEPATGPRGPDAIPR